MTSPESERATDEAAEWLLRHDSGLSPADAQAFAAWRAASAENEQAWAHAQGAWADVEDADDPFVAAMRADALTARPVRRLHLDRVAAGIAAAILLMVAGAGWWGVYGPSPFRRPIEIAVGANPTYQAGLTRRTIALPDGSRVTLDAASALVLGFTAHRRDLRLIRGQALFEVQHDATRPFAVRARDSVVTATGTVFVVGMEAEQIHAILTRGRVVVSRHADEVTLAPGEKVLVRSGLPMAVSATNATVDLAWAEGAVEFRDTLLADAVSQMNRYLAQPIHVLGAARRLRISGRFRVDDPKGFVDAITLALPVRARRRPDGGTDLIAR